MINKSLLERIFWMRLLGHIASSKPSWAASVVEGIAHCKCRSGFDPWPWRPGLRRKWQPTCNFSLKIPCDLRSLGGLQFMGSWYRRTRLFTLTFLTLGWVIKLVTAFEPWDCPERLTWHGILHLLPGYFFSGPGMQAITNRTRVHLLHPNAMPNDQG